MEHTFEVALQWTEGRKGKLSAAELNEQIDCATPPVFPGGVPGYWSPEHLFAASVNSCFMSTFLAVAENFKLSFASFSCRAIASVDKPEGFYCVTSVQLYPTLTLVDSADRDKAIRVLEKSKAACLVSRSIQSAVTMEASVL